MPRSFSQALKSVRELKQDKGSYDQLRVALLKSGVKPDELQWTGADSTFKGRKVTKAELEQFFLDASESLGEEVRMGGRSGYTPSRADADSLVDQYIEQNLENEVEYYLSEVFPDWLASTHRQVSDLNEDELQELIDNFGGNDSYIKENPQLWVTDDLTDAFDEDQAVRYFFGEPESIVEQDLRESLYYDAARDPVRFASERLGIDEDELFSNVEYQNYFPRGGQNYAERLYTYTDPTGQLDYGQLPSQSHFQDSPSIVDDEGGAFLGWARTADFPVEGGGRAYYIGEAQSDAGQKLRRRMRQTGLPARDYEQALGATQYDAAVRPISRSAADAYYRFADAWNDLPPETRASELNRLQLDAFNDYRANQADDFVSIDNIDAMDEGTYDAFNTWRGDRLPGMAVYNSDTAAELARTYGTGYSGQPAFDEALDAYRASQAALDAVRAEQRGLLGFDPRESLASAPFMDSTQKFVDFILRRNLEDAIRSRSDYLAIPYQEEAIANVGGASRPTEGSLDYYRNIVPKRLEKLAQRYDKRARLEPISLIGEGNNPTIEATGLRLTPEFIEEVRKRGIPLWSLGGMGLLSSGVLGQDPQPNSGLLVQ